MTKQTFLNRQLEGNAKKRYLIDKYLLKSTLTLADVVNLPRLIIFSKDGPWTLSKEDHVTYWYCP
jgi:hypothetical protein